MKFLASKNRHYIYIYLFLKKTDTNFTIFFFFGVKHSLSQLSLIACGAVANNKDLKKGIRNFSNI